MTAVEKGSDSVVESSQVLVNIWLYIPSYGLLMKACLMLFSQDEPSQWVYDSWFSELWASAGHVHSVTKGPKSYHNRIHIPSALAAWWWPRYGCDETVLHAQSAYLSRIYYVNVSVVSLDSMPRQFDSRSLMMCVVQYTRYVDLSALGIVLFFYSLVIYVRIGRFSTHLLIVCDVIMGILISDLLLDSI